MQKHDTQKPQKTFLGRVHTALVGPRNTLRYLFGKFATEKDLFAALDGKRVSLVGNARSLSEASFGAEIDDADLVIRFKRAPLPDPQSHGTRTHWLASGMNMDPDLLAGLKPDYLIWTAKLRKLPEWLYGRGKVVIYPKKRHAALTRKLGSPPSAGMMMIDLLARSPARQVNIFGFDFFKSLSLSSNRTAADVPHDYERERQAVEELIRNDKRFVLRR